MEKKWYKWRVMPPRPCCQLKMERLDWQLRLEARKVRNCKNYDGRYFGFSSENFWKESETLQIKKIKLSRRQFNFPDRNVQTS